MSSTDHPDDLHLARDLPTSEADIVAQRRTRHGPTLTFAEALELLGDFDLFPVDTSNRIGGEDWELFEL